MLTTFREHNAAAFLASASDEENDHSHFSSSLRLLEDDAAFLSIAEPPAAEPLKNSILSTHTPDESVPLAEDGNERFPHKSAPSGRAFGVRGGAKGRGGRGNRGSGGRGAGKSPVADGAESPPGKDPHPSRGGRGRGRGPRGSRPATRGPPQIPIAQGSI